MISTIGLTGVTVTFGHYLTLLEKQNQHSMNKKHLLFPTLATLFLFFALACKKKSQSPHELIQGKWLLESYIGHEHSGGLDYRDTADLLGDGFYVDFRADGMVYSYYDGDYDTTAYEVLSASSLVVGNDTNQLSTLTGNKFSIYSKEGDADDYYEYWFNYVK